jgi:TPR repeat protein
VTADPRGRARWLLADPGGAIPPEHAREARSLEPELLVLARGGDPIAQALVGAIALAIRHRPKEARRWFERAAEQGEPTAMRSLGFLFANGIGVKRDVPRAWELLRSAADAGDLYAMYNLAGINTEADGAYASLAESLRLLDAPVAAGMAPAMVLRADLLARLDRDEEAVALYRRAAGLGHSGAMHALGAWARDGIVGPPDRVEAVHWFLRQAAAGDRDGLKRAKELARTMTAGEITEAAARAETPVLGARLR